MANPVTGIRIDPQLKAEAVKTLSGNGLNLSEAVNLFLHETVKRGGLPFDFAKADRDYVGEYLAPIENERFKIESVPRSPYYIRSRLGKRRKYIYGQ